MTRAGTLWVVAIAALGSACTGARGAGRASDGAPARAETPPDVPAAAIAAPCPMAVPNTQVAAEDAPGGVAVTFRTSPEAVADLRARVQAMAEMHNRHPPGTPAGMDAHAGGTMPPGMRGGAAAGSAGSSDGGAATAAPPPSRAFVEDQLDGARMTMTPDDPADLDRLRAAVRAHAERMRETGTCEPGAAPHHG